MRPFSKIICLCCAGCILAVLLSLVHVFAQAAQRKSADGSALGKTFYEKGEYEKAVKVWLTCIEKMNPETESGVYLETLTYLSGACRAIGKNTLGLELLIKALPIAEQHPDISQKALFFCALSELYISTGRKDSALAVMEKARKIVEANDYSPKPNPLVMASVYNTLGNALSLLPDTPKAVSAYQQALSIAERAADKATTIPASELKARILINLALHSPEIPEALTFLEHAYETIINILDSGPKASLLISVGNIGLVLTEKERLSPSDKARILHLCRNSLEPARQIAAKLQDVGIKSRACLYMAELYEKEGRFPEAMQLSRQAFFFGQQVNTPELMYRLYWQRARLLRQTGDISGAIDAYSEAVAILTPVRWVLTQDFRSLENPFDTQIRPVYVEYAEILMKQARTLTDKNAVRSLLTRAMEAVETLKTAELQNYFSDPCVTSMQARQTRLDEAPPHCAVLYPISFSDSLGLLLIIEDEILQVWVPVSNRQLSETARNFRRHLQNRAVYRYWKDGNRLYDWLIRPIENQIKERGIETLIVAPDGALRLIPFSVLPEAKTYLIEKYAIVTVPAMSLTDSGPLDLAATGILVGALSQARRGFDALPNVTKEAEEIRRTAGGQVLEDEQFTLSNLSREIKETEYHVVHMATHGYFGSSGEDSFLLTYDDKLTMNALEELVGYGRFREKPLDLLYLSACQTAVGDERAALGLAGLAVKAGARNAVAGLWMVDDEAAYLTVREFYRNLKDAPGISKAKALQKAQQSLLENSRHHHPASWAPFLLIGNWH